MKNTDAYLFVLTISLLLATPIVLAIHTLLSMRARVIFPLLRMQTGPHSSTLITSVRSMDVIVCPTEQPRLFWLACTLGNATPLMPESRKHAKMWALF